MLPSQDRGEGVLVVTVVKTVAGDTGFEGEPVEDAASDGEGLRKGFVVLKGPVYQRGK